MKKQQQRIDRLKIKGTPAPRNTPTSPLLATSKANKTNNPNVAASDRSYEFILRKANKQALEAMPTGPIHITRRMNYLNRVQHANFGISTMDSPFITSEGTVIEQSPKFVICGQPMNGYSHKSFGKDTSDQRVGNYKTSAQEIYRARHNIKSRARSEPSWQSVEKTQNGESSPTKTEIKDNRSIHSSSFISVPSSASENANVSIRRVQSEKPRSSFELQGRNFKPVNGLNLGLSSSVSGDFVISKPKAWTRRKNSDDKKDESGSSDVNQNNCVTLNVNNGKQQVNLPTSVPKYSKSFIKRGIRNFNNPYRLLKHRERQVTIRTQNLDMKSVQKITNMSNSKDVLEKLPKGASSEAFLLEMMFDTNGQMTRRSNVSCKYSDIALHRDLDEYMVVRTPPSSTRDSPVKSQRGRSGKTYLDELEEESHWAGNDVKEEGIVNGRTQS